MATYATNQNRHMYIASALGISSHKPSLSNPGDIGVYHIEDGLDKLLFFEYKNKKGEIIKSDYIPVKNINYVKAFKASDMIQPLKKVEVTLDSTINSGAPISGQDYVLRINFRQWIGSSEYDQYTKDAAVHATSGMSASDFYKELVNQLNLSFAREIGADKTQNPYLSFAVDNNSTATKVIITEKIQSYSIGTEDQVRVLFDVQPTTIYTGGDDVIWGVVTDATPAKADAVAGSTGIGNGVGIAQQEYFFLGERGDQYRNVGWPNVVITEGLADPTKEYNVLEFHFAFTDAGVNSYRSEKDITIAVPMGASDHEYDVINAIIDEVEYHSGLTIAGLSD